MEKVRNSSYELLKIVSMLMIIMWHVLWHGNVLGNSTGMWHTFLVIVNAILVVHVNSFVLITGYFQCKNKFKLKKILLLNNKAWFYRTLIVILFLIFSSRAFSKIEILYNILPLPILSNDTWFFKVYFILYFLSPFLNKVINNMNKNEFKIYLLILFTLFSFLPTVTNQEFFFNSNGYSIQNFILLYSIGAYLRMYPIEEYKFFKNKNVAKKRVIYIFIFIICFILNSAIYLLGTEIQSISEGLGVLLTSRIFAYDNPLVIIGATSFFCLFGTFNIKSKLINDVARLTFGIYLIHDNYLMRNVIYKFIGLDDVVCDIGIFAKIIFFTFIIFIVCMVIDYFVNILFEKISNIKSIRRIIKKMDNCVM